MASRTTSSAVKGLAENRRKGRRHRLDVSATLSTDGSPSTIDIKITEISVGGVGFSSHAPLQIGHTYHLRAFDSLVQEGMQVRIVSIREAERGGFDAGAVVVNP